MTDKNIEIIDPETLLKMYNRMIKIKESQTKYNKTHKEKINEIHRRCYNKKVANDPEYLKIKALRAKEYYHRKKSEKEFKKV